MRRILVLSLFLLVIAPASPVRADTTLIYEVEGGHSSNVDRVPGGRSSPFLRQSLTIGAEGGDADAFAGFTLRGALDLNGRAPDLDRKELEAVFVLRGSISPGWRADFEQLVRILDDEGLVSRTSRTVAGLEGRFGRITLAPAIQLERTSYDDILLDLGDGFGLILPGTDRDRTEIVAELAFKTELASGFSLGAVTSLARRQMDQSQDIFGRQRGATTYFAGAEARFQRAPVEGFLALGYARRIYDEATFTDVGALMIEGGADIDVGSRGAISLGLSTGFEDDDLFLAKDVLVRRARLVYRHRLIGELVGEAGLEWKQTRYLQTGLTGRTRTWIAALEHPFGPVNKLRLNLERIDARNDPFGPNGHEWKIGFGLVTRLNIPAPRRESML